MNNVHLECCRYIHIWNIIRIDLSNIDEQLQISEEI